LVGEGAIVCLLAVDAGDDCPGADNPGFAPEFLITLETGTTSLSGSHASSIFNKSNPKETLQQ
jgi:hypothetical protein